MLKVCINCVMISIWNWPTASCFYWVWLSVQCWHRQYCKRPTVPTVETLGRYPQHSRNHWISAPTPFLQLMKQGQHQANLLMTFSDFWITYSHDTTIYSPFHSFTGCLRTICSIPCQWVAWRKCSQSFACLLNVLCITCSDTSHDLFSRLLYWQIWKECRVSTSRMLEMWQPDSHLFYKHYCIQRCIQTKWLREWNK